MSIPYAPIHIHSYFSIGRGCLSPEEICLYARRMGYRAVGITDINNFYGLVRFLNAAEHERIKPLIGMVLAVRDRELCTAYVLNRRGFIRLSEIITAQSRKESVDPLLNFLENGWDGLAVLSDDASFLQRLLAREQKELYVKLIYGKSFSSLVHLARELDLPLCAVNDSYFHEDEEMQICNLLRAIDRITVLEDLPAGQKLKADLHRQVGSEQMSRFFSAVPESLSNAWALIQQADNEGIISRKQAVFPSFNGLSEVEAFRELKTLCFRGIRKRYPEHTTGKRLKERLDYELSIIRKKRFAGYFLVVHDIVSRCPRTCGRGSSAASIVSYLLEITHVDPLHYNLFFERFLNMERKDPPDIDVDFPWDERKKALKYVFERYKGRAGMVADHVTFGPRSAIREPAKALGLPEKEIKKMVCFYRRGEFTQIPSYLLKIAERIRGFPHYLGTHPGGVVITPEPITNYTHVQLSPLGYPVIAWGKEAAEDAGLVKIDLLGNRSLAVLRDTIELVNHRYGRNITWESFCPLESKETREFIASGSTLGVFYIESPATRQLLKKMRTGDFKNLVIASSIIRPAANRYIREFVKRLHGEAYVPLCCRLEETLKETYGIMVFQEDVSRVVIDVAGFSAGEADCLRKILSKRDRLLRIGDFKAKFFRRGTDRGVPVPVLKKIWDMILSFEGYSFCKAHSASYALVSYKLAYLKRFNPLEFFVSVINNGGGFYSRQTYLNECRRLGFRIMPPDVNASRMQYTVEGRESLRIGLGQIKDLNRSVCQRIIREREAGHYADFRDFLKRVSPGLPEIRVLIRSGSLDSISGTLSRPQLFWAFFRLGNGLLPEVPHCIGDYPENLKLLDEVRTLGLMISIHPLSVFSERVKQMMQKERFPRLISSREIPLYRGRQVSLAGLLVTGKEVSTRNGERMVFVSFEDEFSIFETVFFPAAFKNYYPAIDNGGLFLISGRVEEDLSALSINVSSISNVSKVMRVRGLESV